MRKLARTAIAVRKHPHRPELSALMDRNMSKAWVAFDKLEDCSPRLYRAFEDLMRASVVCTQPGWQTYGDKLDRELDRVLEVARWPRFLPSRRSAAQGTLP